jgi:uncharacterized protein (TIGR02271 family)
MRNITAMFENRADAEAAVERLVQDLHIGRGAITIHGADSTTGADTEAPKQEQGFWAGLKDLFVSDEDRYTYSEGLRRGHVVLSAQVDDTTLVPAMDALEASGAMDLEDRETSWRSEGWNGYDEAAAGETSIASTGGAAMPAASTAGYAGAGLTGAATGAVVPGLGTTSATTAGTPTAGTTTAGATGYDVTAADTGAYDASATRTTATGTGTGTGTALAGTTSGQEETIKLAEERLHVGKRDVERGRVRVRTYVVETPVSEEVSLRDERVTIERRPLDRAATPNEALFQDRTIEAVEHAEEAVVAKDVRVTEELSVRKEVDQRSETVRDTVRRTEVEVEDDRTVRPVAPARP